MDLLVTYDIATPDESGQRRLLRVAAICERYGTRVQYSVFECRIDAIALERLVSEILEEIIVSLDSVNIYRMGADFDTVRTSLGRQGWDWDEPLIF